MKEEYTKLTCIVCGKISHVPKGADPPYTLSIRSEGCIFTKDRPKLDCSVCLSCVKEVGKIIDHSISKNKPLPQRQEIREMTCDVCNHSVTINTFETWSEPVDKDWLKIRSAGKRLDLCGHTCLVEHIKDDRFHQL